MKIDELKAYEIQDALDEMEEPAWCDHCNEFRDCGNNNCPECGNELMFQFRFMQEALEAAQDRENEARFIWEQTYGTPLLPHTEDGAA